MKQKAEGAGGTNTSVQVVPGAANGNLKPNPYLSREGVVTSFDHGRFPDSRLSPTGRAFPLRVAVPCRGPAAFDTSHSSGAVADFHRFPS